MRDLYIKDGDKLFRSSPCQKCGGDKLIISTKTLNEMKILVKNDISYIMPMQTLFPEEGITYECKCNEQDNYTLVRKEIPVWVDKRVYDLNICPNCKGESTVTVHAASDDNTSKDTMHDLELHCSRCHVETNLSKVTISEKTAAQRQQGWDEYVQNLDENDDTKKESASKTIKFDKPEQNEEDYFDVEIDYEPNSKTNENHSKIEPPIGDDDFEISLDMDIEI